MTLKDRIKPPKLDFTIEKPDLHLGRNWSDEGAQAYFDAWYAEHIEPLFAHAVEVTGFADEFQGGFYGEREDERDTHRALLIGIELIEKGVPVKEIVEALRSGEWTPGAGSRIALADRIEREGVKNG